MAPPRKTKGKGERADIIRSVTTPLGFYVLVLLLIEAFLGILTYSIRSPGHVWQGFVAMIVAFCVIVLIVTAFVIFAPKRLLYGKEEHAALDALDPGALRDSVEDIIVQNVKPECLNKPHS